MRKRICIAVLTTLSLVLTGLSGFSRQKVQADSSDLHTFERVFAGQNDGLIHYKYVDDEGNEVVPLSKKETSSRKQAANLPISYDSRETGMITSIKNQGVTGSCWAFGALKSLEASCITNGLYSLESADLSENHLAWYSYTPLQDTTNPLYGDYLSFDTASGSEIYNIGGNAFTAMFTLANGWGAVTEDKAPFTADSQTEANAMAAAMNSQPESLRSQSDVQIREVNCYDESNNSQQWNEIKQAVMEYGALDVSLYYNAKNLYQDADVTSMYQKKAKPGDANHCVSIVGWDDNFNTFQTDPEGPGAWLIANSYGEDYGMNGYFWLSYYDTSLCEFYSFEAETNTYDNSFQYDGSGWKTGYFDNDDIALANVFTNDTETPQRIDAAAFYTYADSQNYKIEIYRNLKDSGPLDGEPVSRCTTSGTAERSGYHTVSLSEPIAVAPGERFSVIVTFLAGSGSDRMAYALVEGDSSPENGLYFHSESGQSYVYFASEDKWYDNTSLKNEDGTIQNMNNVCVKAFSNAISEEAFAEQEKNYVPETPAPRVTQTPANTTNANSPFPTAANSSGTLPTITPASSPLPSGTPSADDDSSSAAIKLSVKKLTIGKGEQVKLPVTTKPASAKKKLTYQSSKKKIVSVNSNGKITGRKTGTAKITVRTPSGTKKNISVRVKKAPSSIQITAPKKKIKKGKTVPVKTKLSKGSASYQLTFRSLNQRVASVTAKGKIKAKKKGIVTIQVITYNGKKTYKKIRVVS
ncbi:MAG: Ig-like domain-containing protein [Lachnospiraceae bacterium]|nr:Ig-like domain-containing protein [Lachnospiraceae bacterium]